MLGLGVEHYDDCAPGGLNCPQREAGEFCPVVAGGDSVGARRRDGGCRARGEFTAPGASNCLSHFPRAALRLRWAIFGRSLRAGGALWPVCEAAPVGDGEINLTFMRLPCSYH